MTKGDIHRAEYFLRNGWYDRAEGALTDAALFLHDNKRAYDLTKPGHRAEFAETKRELCRVYDALATQKGSASMKLRAAALRAGLGVFAMYVRARGVTGRVPRPSLRSATSPQSEELAAKPA